jgi:CRISPR-associated protein Csd1
MTILQALDRYYHRLADRGEVVAPGWSPEKFGWCIEIDGDGHVVDVLDLHDQTGKKPRPALFTVPAAVKRTVGIVPNFLWDKTAYVLGRTAGEGKRTAQEHAAFVALHRQRLAGQQDAGLVALVRFLERWRPERFDEAPFRADMLDANVMFRLNGEQGYIHQRPAARALIEAEAPDAGAHGAMCLISGEEAPIARLHPTIKGVDGAQTAGAALVSFNLDAFTSLGKDQGANAPTNQAAAFRYGTALNHLLARGGGNRLRRPIGDATVVFWADASNAPAVASLFAVYSDPPSDAQQARKVGDELEAIASGRPIEALHADIADNTPFYVLGLSPNAARLAVRFWLSGGFGDFARNLARHHRDTLIEPRPVGWNGAPSVGVLLVRSTALLGKFENIPPLLAGETMRAVLTGARYPHSLLAAAIIRLRAGDNPGLGWHAAVMRAVLVRARRTDPAIPETGETPMALDREHPNIGYLLGRLFAVYELAQVAALGRGVKATMRDKYFASAAATPATVFPLVIAHGQNHLSKARKTPQSAGWAFLIERELGAIMDRIVPGLPHSLPRSLRLEDQAEFAIGYYHQRSARLKSDKGDDISLADHDTAAGEDEE